MDQEQKASLRTFYPPINRTIWWCLEREFLNNEAIMFKAIKGLRSLALKRFSRSAIAFRFQFWEISRKEPGLLCNKWTRANDQKKTHFGSRDWESLEGVHKIRLPCPRLIYNRVSSFQTRPDGPLEGINHKRLVYLMSAMKKKELSVLQEGSYKYPQSASRSMSNYVTWEPRLEHVRTRLKIHFYLL